MDSPIGEYLRDPFGFLLRPVKAVFEPALDLVQDYGPLLLFVLVAAVAGRVLLQTLQARQDRDQARWVEVLPPPAADLDGAAQLWSALHDTLPTRLPDRLAGRRAHLGWELLWSANGALRIGLWVPRRIPPGAVEQAVEGAWPGCRTRTHTPPSTPVPPDQPVEAGTLRLRYEEWFALKHDHRADPMRAILAGAGQLRPGETAAVQLLARPVGPRRLRRAERAAVNLKTGRVSHSPARSLLFGVLDLVEGLISSPRATGKPTTTTAPTVHDPARAKDVTAILAKTQARPCWEIVLRYAVTGPANARALTAAGRRQRQVLRGRAFALASAFGVFKGRNDLARGRLPRAAASLNARSMGKGDLVCLPELVALAHLPVDGSVPGLSRAGARALAPTSETPETGRVLGHAEAGGRRPVALAIPDARQHVHLMGSTGTGKSTLLANLILQDAIAGRGAVVLDPKGDLITDLLDRLPEEVGDRLVLLDPAEALAPPSLNVLDGPDPELTTDHLVGIFRNIFANYWGPRTDEVLRAACLTLLRPSQQPNRDGDRRDSEPPTLADVPRLLTDPAYRTGVVASVPADSALGGFWTWYDRLSDAARANATGPVLSRLRTFLLRGFVRDTIGSARSSFDLGEVLDGGLLLARLPKGILGADNARLLGSLLVARAWQTALHRARHGHHLRRDTSLYVDECHNFMHLPVAFEELFAEARGYHLSLILAHQHLGQLPRELRDAMSANARNKVWFTMSPEDAHDLARHVAPDLSEHDLSHLGGYQAAARLIVDGIEAPPCTLRTRPAPSGVPGRAERLRDLARRHAGASRTERHEQRLHAAPDAPDRRGLRPADIHPSRPRPARPRPGDPKSRDHRPRSSRKRSRQWPAS